MSSMSSKTNRGERDFQEVVRGYDHKYWRHSQGADTLVHTYLHLLPSICHAVGEAWPTDLDVYKRELPGRLLEHAARLANQCQAQVVFYVARNHDTVVEIWWQRRRETTLPVSHGSRLVTEFDIGTGLLVELAPLGRILEKIHHGYPFDPSVPEHVRPLLPFVGVLLRYSYHLVPGGPTYRCGTRCLEGKRQHLQRFLQPLRERMRMLEDSHRVSKRVRQANHARGATHLR